MKQLILLFALLALAPTADAGRRGNVGSAYDPQAPRYGSAVLSEDPFWLYFSKPRAKRGLGGTDPCCAEDPGQQPRK